MTNPPDQPRRGRPPLPPGMAKVKRNIRVGPIWDEAERVAEEDGETMTALVEAALNREVHRRYRKRRAESEKGAPE